MGGLAAGGGISSALGSVANLFSTKMLMKYQYKLTRKLRRNAYQDTMEDMANAGLNPILAYQRGPTGGGGGIASSMGFDKAGQAIAAGAQAGAGRSQAKSAKGLRKVQEALAREQMRAAGAQADLHGATAQGVRLQNIIRQEEASWAMTEAGKAAIHGKMVGGGPIGTGVATAMDMALESLKGPSKTGPIEIYGPGAKPNYKNYPKGGQKPK